MEAAFFIDILFLARSTMTGNRPLNPMPRRLRAAQTTTRNGLSSMLRLARTPALAGMAQRLSFRAHTMVQFNAGVRAGFATPLYPSDIR